MDIAFLVSFEEKNAVFFNLKLIGGTSGCYRSILSACVRDGVFEGGE
jgi:hypothetical protein